MGSFTQALDSLFDRNGTLVMGILNVTPDSFFDGGRWEREAAISRFDELVAQGASVIDIGGESTRPGARCVPAQEQISRIAPVLQHAASASRVGVLVTVDTTDAAVAEFALEAGVDAINDVSCLADPRIAGLTARYRAGLIIMHARGAMCDMPGYSMVPESSHQDVILEISREWCAARNRAVREGMAPDDIVFDPGLGFWKSARHSMDVLRRLDEFHTIGARMMIGASRKSFLTLADPGSPDDRLGASIAACLHAARLGVQVVRVHDVATTHQALRLDRLLNQGRDCGARSLGEAC